MAAKKPGKKKAAAKNASGGISWQAQKSAIDPGDNSGGSTGDASHTEEDA